MQILRAEQGATLERYGGYRPVLMIFATVFKMIIAFFT
jgi:hypothetical protein